MHNSTDCYVAKGLLAVKYQITAHRPSCHAWHVAKMSFVTVAVYKGAQQLRKKVMVAEKSFSWVVPYNRAICPTGTQLYTLVIAVIG